MVSFVYDYEGWFIFDSHDYTIFYRKHGKVDEEWNSINDSNDE